jgi:hypothetical protein
MNTLKELIKDHQVTFQYYRDHELWYRIEDTDFLFPVHINEITNTTFPNSDKAIFFMRWIRKYMEEIQNNA